MSIIIDDRDALLLALARSSELILQSMQLAAIGQSMPPAMVMELAEAQGRLQACRELFEQRRADR